MPHVNGRSLDIDFPIYGDAVQITERTRKRIILPHNVVGLVAQLYEKDNSGLSIAPDSRGRIIIDGEESTGAIVLSKSVTLQPVFEAAAQTSPKI